MTLATRLVLSALLADPAHQHYGYELLKATRLKSGSLYPILERLERQGWIVGHWESPQDGVIAGRPPRRYYRLTGTGVRNARLALSEVGGGAVRLDPAVG
jgi:PadR family transcriptional regulator PadR